MFGGEGQTSGFLKEAPDLVSFFIKEQAIDQPAKHCRLKSVTLSGRGFEGSIGNGIHPSFPTVMTSLTIRVAGLKPLPPAMGTRIQSRISRRIEFQFNPILHLRELCIYRTSFYTCRFGCSGLFFDVPVDGRKLVGGMRARL